MITPGNSSNCSQVAPGARIQRFKGRTPIAQCHECAAGTDQDHPATRQSGTAQERGLDHVLFVLCLVVGAPSLAGLLWRVTGFTLGHSVTLSLGFFGFVPAGDWFIPAVELTIATTIIYAAVIAILPRKQQRGEIGMFAVTGFIGLIHGLGFSFVLQKILKVSSPNIWQSLLAFNVGIELGQLLIVLVAGLGILLAKKAKRGLELSLRRAAAGGAALVAAYWVVERSLPLLATV